MYPRKIPLTIATFNHGNLKLIREINTGKEIFFTKYINMFRQFTISDAFKDIKETKQKLHSIIRERKLYRSIQNNFYDIPRNFRDQSSFLIKAWTHQCECILAQRIRRGLQMFSLYSKLWEEKALRYFINRTKMGLFKKSRDFLFGAVSLASFNWNKDRITENDMRAVLNEFEYVYKMRDNTLCKKCHKSILSKHDNICSCDDYKSANTPTKFEDWETFIEKKDLVVWRRMRESGHFEYKVYGSYPDVTAEEFLNVQVDTNYRRIWDTTAIALDVVETDPDPENNSDIVYWEMLWPMLFANRDYVFTRRYLVDYDAKKIVIANKSVCHPKVSEKSDKFRVKDYWSYMVIKPYKELNQYGIEFVLTYYDNPGVSIPSKVTTWVAMRAMPDFLERLREASKKYKAYCKEYGVKCICQFKQVEFVEKRITPDIPNFWVDPNEIITDNTISEAQHNIKASYNRQSDPPKPQVPYRSSSPNESTIDLDPSTKAAPIVQRGTKYFWKYLYPSYYNS